MNPGAVDPLASRVASRFVAAGEAHVQTFVKVNAPVDEGIASVIEALALVPRLTTVASCQGDDESHGAIVYLRFGDHGEESERPIRYDQVDFYCWFHGALFSRISPKNHKLIVSGTVGTDGLAFE